MGDYADMEIESSLASLEYDLEHLEEIDDPLDGTLGIPVIRVDVPPVKLKYKKIIRETDKAWMLELGNGTSDWFPKSRCELVKRSHIVISPAWLIRAKGIIPPNNHKEK